MSSPLIDASSWLPEWGLTVASMTTSTTISEVFEPSFMPGLFYKLLFACFMIEICFAILFHFYLVPRANQRISPQPYRDFGNDREFILMQILERIKKNSSDKESFQKAVASYFHEWCEPVKEQPLKAKEESSPASDLVHDSWLTTKESILSWPPPRPLRLSRESMSLATTFDSCESSSSSMDDDDDMKQEKLDFDEKRAMSPQQHALALQSSSSSPLPALNDETYIVPDIGRDEVDVFAAWALFEKEPSQLLEWERAILDKCYQLAEQKYGIGIAPGSCHRYKARRLSLEDVNSLWRPLAFYIFFWTLTIVGAAILRMAGFQRIVSLQTGLAGWYRPPAATTNGQSLLPLLFFHGIAPAGLFVYIPMILSRLANDDRAVMLFDNTNISCALGFGALREAETVQGVMELVDRYLPTTKSTGLCLCGHSFGSCPLTWLLHAPAMRHRIKQFVLLDPVTILLSEPDVMANFLYSTGCSTIRLMAGSELFTEYYLRRHFAWYNSELWLEDIPESVQVLIALSEKDEIVNAPKVKKYIDTCGSTTLLSPSCCKVLFREEATHSMCVTRPSRWSEIKQAMLEQEQVIAKKSR